MLDATLKTQLQTYLGMLRRPIRLIASLDDSDTAAEMRSLLDDIVSLSDKVSLDTTGNDARKPSFVVARNGESTVSYTHLSPPARCLSRARRYSVTPDINRSAKKSNTRRMRGLP